MHKKIVVSLITFLALLSTLPVSAQVSNFGDSSNLDRNLTMTETGDASKIQAASDPEIGTNRNSLNFGAEAGGSHTGDQTLIISNDGDGCLTWTATASDPWMLATPLSGNGGTVVTVSVDPTGLADGTYNGTLTFTSPNAANSPVVFPVSLTVYAAGAESPPFGVFDNPINGSTVRSVVPVTGWALDDIEVFRLKIYRDPLTGEGSGLVYIGDAVFVDGARTDVEAAYPTFPNNSKAGWGYMLNTYFLPNGGNGTYTLRAIAGDSSGSEVTLGAKTITVDNANAVKPFGAIDTPGSGGAASGASFINFGWALTPQPNTIPTDGSTIDVFVDGVFLDHPIYNIYRADIATLFPGYNNSSGAGGNFSVDTTAYENGVHTIAWSVEDDAGNSDGVGSRYFNIENPATVYVDDNFNASTPGWGSDHFASIQDGIDHVAVDGTVDVAAGAYPESPALGKDVCVSLNGDVDLNGGLSVLAGTLASSAGNLNLSGNLSTTSGYFDPNGGTVHFDGSGNQTISGDTVFFNLVVGNGVTLETTADITVDGTLVNNGVTRETKTISGAGAYAYGLADVSIDLTQAGLTSLQLERRDQNHPNATTGIQTGKYWSFTPVGAGFTLDMTLPHNNVPTVNDKVCRYTGVGTIWDCAADSFDTGANTITRQGITQLSEWATGDDVGPTALTMIKIKARSMRGANVIGLALLGFLMISIGSTIIFGLRRTRR